MSTPQLLHLQVVLSASLPLFREVTLHRLLVEKGHTPHCIGSGCLMLAFYV